MPNLKLHHNIVEDCQKILSNSPTAARQNWGIVRIKCKDGFIDVQKIVLALTSTFWRRVLELPTNDNILLLAPEYDKAFFQSYIKLCTFGMVKFDKLQKEQGFETFAEESKDKKVKSIQLNVDGQDEYTCPICAKTFETSQSCNRHIQTMHGDKKKYICPTCGKEYKTKEGLRSHTINNHQNKDPHICRQPNCGTVFQNRGDLLRHCRLKGHKFPKSLKKTQTSTCDICFQEVRGNIQEHKKNYHITKKFECPHCDHDTVRKDALTRHKIAKHNYTNKNIDAIKEFFTEDGTSFQCQECKKILDSKDNAKKHLLQQTCEEHKCNECGKVFKLKQHLKQHLSKVHKVQL